MTKGLTSAVSLVLGTDASNPATYRSVSPVRFAGLRASLVKEGAVSWKRQKPQNPWTRFRGTTPGGRSVPNLNAQMELVVEPD